MDIIKPTSKFVCFIIIYHTLLSILNIYDSVRSESSSDSASDDLNQSPSFNMDHCDCFTVTLYQIDPYHHDMSILCYVYDIQRKYTSSQCYFGIDEIILSICNNDNIHDLQHIYDSIIDYYPTTDDDFNPISLSQSIDPLHNITGLAISMYIQDHIQFHLCLNGIYTIQTADKVRFKRAGDTAICGNNNGLPCIKSTPTIFPTAANLTDIPPINPTVTPTENTSIKSTLIPTISPIQESCVYTNELDVVILMSKSCGLTENLCQDVQEFIAETLSCFKNGNVNPRVAYIEFDQHTHIKYDLLHNQNDFDINDFYELYNIIRNSQCNPIPNDITNLVNALQIAMNQFIVGHSDSLQRDKKIVIFSCAESNIHDVCAIFRDKIFIENIDIIPVNIPFEGSINDPIHYLQCLTKDVNNIFHVDINTISSTDIISSEICHNICNIPPSSKPTIYPTLHPTNTPSLNPSTTVSPTYPTLSPIDSPHPTDFPTINPTPTPTLFPTISPLISPTLSPSITPSLSPTNIPSKLPTNLPSIHPTNPPTAFPSSNPSIQPTKLPTVSPTIQPTIIPTLSPSYHPSISPTNIPTTSPTMQPSETPSIDPTIFPSLSPSNIPSVTPSIHPTTIQPTAMPTDNPSRNPTEIPTKAPTRHPTPEPTVKPTLQPTVSPTMSTSNPSHQPTVSPTPNPSPQPTLRPTYQPSRNPSIFPTINPSLFPTNNPSQSPTTNPTITPSNPPTIHPTNQPSNNPSKSPIRDPTTAPTSCDDPCDAYNISINAIFPDVFDPTATIYQYSIEELSNEGICTGNVAAFVLGICQENNISVVNVIFDSILTYAPQVIGNKTVVVTKLNTTLNPFGIGGIQVDAPIDRHNLIFSLILRNINTSVLSDSVAFNREEMDYSCKGDGLPCLSTY